MNTSNQYKMETLRNAFPGSVLHQKWVSKETIENAPIFAIMILLGAKVVENPRGTVGFVCILKDEKEHVLYKEDYDVSKKMAGVAIKDFFMKKNYGVFELDTVSKLLVSKPTLILECLDFLYKYMEREQTVDVGDRIRIMLTIPDDGACGHYRTKMLFNYIRDKYKQSFYSDTSISISNSAFSFYDCISYNRVPARFPYGIFQNLMSDDDRTFLYECDDDLMNIPDWNFVSDLVSPYNETVFKDSIKNCDVVYVTTEKLKENMIKYSGYKDGSKFFVCPNLIDLNRFNGYKYSTKHIDLGMIGFKPVRDGSLISNKGTRANKKTQEKFKSGKYNTIKILWFGSQTHDKDLEIIVNPVLKLGEKYGISIRFYFFGYCPIDFVDSIVEKGNIAQTLAIKNKYIYFIDFIQGTSFTNYVEIIKKIDPDIGICPLYNHEFNLCKSNLKVLEFGALGIPCVVSNFGEYKFIEDGVTGYKADTENEWVEHIEKLINSKTLRDEISKNIKRTVCNDWSWDNDSDNRKKWDHMIDNLYFICSRKKSNLKNKIDSILT